MEGNINAIQQEYDSAEECVHIDMVELQARIYTDLEILAMNQEVDEPAVLGAGIGLTSISEFARLEEEARRAFAQFEEDHLGVVPDEPEEPSSADR